jgi:hypothetical protein
MKTLFAILLLGSLTFPMFGSATPVSFAVPSATSGQETVGDLVIDGRWG